MDFSQYLRIVRKWWWLVVLAAFVAGAISFVANTGRPPVYRAETILSIGYVLDSPNPDLSAFRTQIELATNYVQILRTYEVLENTVNALGLPISPEILRGAFRARLIEGTSLLTISVDSVDPVQAADIANELAVQLINKTPRLVCGRARTSQLCRGAGIGIDSRTGRRPRATGAAGCAARSIQLDC